MTPNPDTPGLLNWALIIALGIIWGSAFMAIALSLEGFSPGWTAALRVGIGALAVSGFATALGQSPLRIFQVPGAWRFVAVVGLCTAAVPMVLLSWAVQYVPSAFAGVAMGTVPLLILPLAYVFSPEEGIGPRRIFGVTLGFCGILLLLGPAAFTGGAFWAQVACVAAACCYAVGSIVTRRAPTLPPLAFASGALLVGAICLVPGALLVEGPPPLAPLKPTLALLYLGLFPTGLAAMIRLRVITTAGSVFMSQTSFMVPLWSAIFGVALMSEALPPSLWGALALILTGLAVAQSGKR